MNQGSRWGRARLASHETKTAPKLWRKPEVDFKFTSTAAAHSRLASGDCHQVTWTAVQSKATVTTGQQCQTLSEPVRRVQPQIDADPGQKAGRAPTGRPAGTDQAVCQ